LEESENLTIDDLREKNRHLQQAFDELKAAQAQIVEKERLERELEVARDIQISILPRELPEDPGWEFGVHFSSMEAVGGDFYDVIELDNGKLGVAVGDVSGHGVPAALFMSLTATLLRAEAKRFNSPGDILRAVNNQLLETSDSGMFVTVLYGILDSSANSFEYARAGHSTPLLAVPGEPPVQLEDGLGQLLGVFDDMVLDEVTIPLNSDSVMIIYTDGVTEAANESKEFFGEEGLLEAVGSGDEMQPDALLQRIWKAVQAFQGEASNEDDITLLAIRAK
jgi:sigma-B regulation protein RsbU (phosphoserine phosphatase)